MPNRSNPDRLIVVGALAGAHGVRGDVRVKSFTDDPHALFDLGPLLSEAGDILLEAQKLKPGSDHFIVTPKTARQKEEWDGLKGTRLYVRRSALPPPEDDEFYVEDLIGLKACDEHGEQVGAIKSVQNFGAGDLLEIETSGKTTTFFVPFTLKDVPEVHFQTGFVTIHDAEGWADQSDPRKSETD